MAWPLFASFVSTITTPVDVMNAAVSAGSDAAPAQQSQLELTAILENGSAGILFTHDRIIQRCNQRLAEIYLGELGLTPQPQGERRIWMRLLPPDDAADVVQLAPPDQRDDLLTMLDENTHTEVTALLAYKEDQAGGLMNPRFARLRPEMTVDEAIGYLRRQAAHLETMYYAYALDPEQRLLGVVSFRNLFSADRTKTVRNVMRPRFISVRNCAIDSSAHARIAAADALASVLLLSSSVA